ncbi:MAG: hypothetical protein U0401_05985 [Anaerolineae bacterium]
MLEFEALHIPALTSEVASNLENSLRILPGVETYKINVETRQIQVVFDEQRLGFVNLIQAMSVAGCPLRSINAALLKDLSRK